MLGRRGFSLVELVVAMALFGMFGAAVTSVLLHGARRSFAVRGMLAREESLREAVRLVRHELEPLDPATDELTVQGDSLLRLPAERGSGIVCELRSATIVAGRMLAVRRPVALRDALLLFADDDEARDDDDRWLEMPIAALADATCPDGSPALAFELTAPVAPAIRLGAPVLVREPFELRRYVSSGTTWFGARAVATGESIQPVAGPFAAGTGIVFSGIDASRTAAAGRLIAQVAFAARSSEGGRTDSLRASIGLWGARW